MQIDLEKLTRQIKVISQDAWKVEQNTTVNMMIEYVVKEALKLVIEQVETEINNHNKTIEDLYEKIASFGISPELEDRMDRLEDILLSSLTNKETTNGSNGRGKNAQRNTQAKGSET